MGFFRKAQSFKVVRTKATVSEPALSSQLRQRYALLLASFVATSAIACGAEDPSVMDEGGSDLGKIAQDITGGTLVSANSNLNQPQSSVVSLNTGVCTGLKVGPLMYLTANHCGFVKDQFVTTTNGIDGVGPMNDHGIVQVFDHPTTFAGRVNNNINLTTQWDLTLVQVEYDDGIPVHTPNYIKQSVGDTGTFFGYGCDKVFPKRIERPKQFGISSATGNTNSSIFSASARPQICPGDSGGPFFKIVNGVYRLEGVNRALGTADNNSYWNRVFGASQWIDAVKAGLSGINDLTNGKEGTFLSKTSNYCMGSFYTQQACSFRESADQRFTVQVSGANIRFVGQGNNAGQCLGVADTFSGTAITHVTCGTPGSNWVSQNPDATGRYRQYKNVWAQHCMRSTSLGTGTTYDQQPCSSANAYPDQYFTFSK